MIVGSQRYYAMKQQPDGTWTMFLFSHWSASLYRFDGLVQEHDSPEQLNWHAHAIKLYDEKNRNGLQKLYEMIDDRLYQLGRKRKSFEEMFEPEIIEAKKKATREQLMRSQRIGHPSALIPQSVQTEILLGAKRNIELLMEYDNVMW